MLGSFQVNASLPWENLLIPYTRFIQRAFPSGLDISRYTQWNSTTSRMLNIFERPPIMRPAREVEVGPGPVFVSYFNNLHSSHRSVSMPRAPIKISHPFVFGIRHQEQENGTPSTFLRNRIVKKSVSSGDTRKKLDMKLAAKGKVVKVKKETFSRRAAMEKFKEGDEKDLFTKSTFPVPVVSNETKSDPTMVEDVMGDITMASDEEFPLVADVAGPQACGLVENLEEVASSRHEENLQNPSQSSLAPEVHETGEPIIDKIVTLVCTENEDSLEITSTERSTINPGQPEVEAATIVDSITVIENVDQSIGQSISTLLGYIQSLSAPDDASISERSVELVEVNIIQAPPAVTESVLIFVPALSTTPGTSHESLYNIATPPLVTLASKKMSLGFLMAEGSITDNSAMLDAVNSIMIDKPVPKAATRPSNPIVAEFCLRGDGKDRLEKRKVVRDGQSARDRYSSSVLGSSQKQDERRGGEREVGRKGLRGISKDGVFATTARHPPVVRG